MYGPVVPDQRARLSVPSIADITRKGLQGDVLLIVGYNAGALRETCVTGGAVWVYEGAPVVCHTDASAFHWDLYFLNGALWQDF